VSTKSAAGPSSTNGIAYSGSVAGEDWKGKLLRQTWASKPSSSACESNASIEVPGGRDENVV
jgi:hypothetical protein